MALSRKFKLGAIYLLMLVSAPLFGNEGYNLSDGESAVAQSVKPTTPDSEYLKNDIKTKRFDWNTWEKNKKGMQYGEKPKKPSEQEKQTSEGQTSTNKSEEGGTGLNLGPIAQILLILAVISLLVLLVFFTVKQGWLHSNTRIEPAAGNPILLEDIEDKLHETDLERALRLALEAKDYRMAIRIYYLSIIKELSLLQWIYWKRDKTNGQYVREMASRPNAEDFKRLTIAFDRTWYGNDKVEMEDYETLSPLFKNFIQNLKKR